MPPIARLDEHNFFCRGCGKKVMSSRCPGGWYTVQRKADDGRYAKLGIFCSAVCLARSAAEDMLAAERSMGDAWVTKVPLTTPFRGDRAPA